MLKRLKGLFNKTQSAGPELSRLGEDMAPAPKPLLERSAHDRTYPRVPKSKHKPGFNRRDDDSASVQGV